MSFSIWWAVAILGGVCASLQSHINGDLSKKIGVAATVTLSTLIFTILCVFYLAWEAANSKVPWPKIREISSTDYLGGVAGFTLVLCMTLAFPRLGALYSVVLMILGQTVAAFFIDQNITATRVAAILFIVAGVFLANK